MTNPVGAVIKTSTAETYGFETLQADRDGRWNWCFSNHASMVTPKVVSFYVYHSGNEERLKPGKSTAEVDPVEREVGELTENLQSVRDHQQYMIQRNDQHHATAKSTNQRVQWWSLMQIGIIIAVAVFQINYMRKTFDVKRVV